MALCFCLVCQNSGVDPTWACRSSDFLFHCNTCFLCPLRRNRCGLISLPCPPLEMLAEEGMDLIFSNVLLVSILPPSSSGTQHRYLLCWSPVPCLLLCSFPFILISRCILSLPFPVLFYTWNFFSLRSYFLLCSYFLDVGLLLVSGIIHSRTPTEETFTLLLDLCHFPFHSFSNHCFNQLHFHPAFHILFQNSPLPSTEIQLCPTWFYRGSIYRSYALMYCT